jgi:hypothetical protein
MGKIKKKILYMWRQCWTTNSYKSHQQTPEIGKCCIGSFGGVFPKKELGVGYKICACTFFFFFSLSSYDFIYDVYATR